jgi:microcystin-dependent protein
VGTPFLAEIRLMSFNFAPRGWAQCNGQLLPINQNQALFALLGTTYGGNGQTNFALPDLRGRVAMHVGAGYTQGQVGGAAAHTLTQAEMPAHVHAETAMTGAATSPVATGNRLAVANNQYAPAANLTSLAPSLSSVGGSQPHENRQPYIALMFCIALTNAIFPSPS